ncbi:hypothetical protein M316_0008 [Nitrincola phage 1M3-16]|uniref:hypothetical protein n=1 Tax=Nitrincola phage 1M3-16 TaxID=1472912 RepID=UPI000444D271|nr:hypothetical protein GJ22_gp144 [Nitrincola phage 1M3-16]AHX01073.1 hypothetical protein M316_0008 [Nitrincola phage 1M3-16]
METRKGCIIEALKQGEVDYIIHQVNCQGVMGSGLAKSIKREFPRHFKTYMSICEGAEHVQILLGSSFLRDRVIGVFGQNFYGTRSRHTNYAALCSGIALALKACNERKDYEKYSIGIPYKLGCGLGGGDWEVVALLINDIGKMFPNVEFVVYNNEGKRS